MKKHPIDELFETKLKGHGLRPSNEAWEKIQARRNDKRQKLPSWVWYAAAGLSLTLATAYMVWQTEIRLLKNEGARVATISKPVSDGEIKEVLPQDLKNVEAGSLTNKPVITHEEKESGISVGQNEVIANLDGFNDSDNREITGEIQELKRGGNVAGTYIESFSQVDIQSEVAPIQENTDLKAPVIPTQKHENRVVLVTVQEPISDTSETNKAKTSKFSRVLRQLKNAREGERVDWTEMGINTKSILARADNDDANNSSDNHKTKK